ncbi:MAG: adenylosuccinate synthase [Betaproteobacteria bacterium AqS2]|uniref:Adenylosuccinate synthetase n=1 Tax=Candidatus Amphirhobacter heronislandensis TaxID=1732024 RepID=A0A930UDD3_9GAMM|nr:adenylosuccinate synthase [Betaproteobacteria bacterium AqS2]
MSPGKAAACRALVGLQWGDEGKGKLIDWLAAEARHVARFQGGHNAGHTVVVEGRKFVLHLLPSGVINEGCRCYIGQGVALDLAALLEEIEILRQGGVDCAGRLAVSPHCALVMPHHVQLDAAREQQAAGKIGTTLRGIGPAQEDRAARCAVRLGDVLAGAARIEASVAKANCQLAGLHGAPAADAAAIAAEIAKLAEQVKPYVADVPAELEAAAGRGEAILLEGAQGALLDIEQGSYPFVTSSSCLASGSAPGLGIDLRPEVIGVAKAYVTRVGMGALPTRIEGKEAEFLVEQGAEFGATTSRRRDVGWLDIPALRHALRLNACGSIALTKLDVLGLLERVKVCVAYRLDGERLASWPPSDRMLQRCEPEWIELPGWGALPDKVEAYDELPAACRDYVAKIEELAGARVEIVSCGPERGATLWRT